MTKLIADFIHNIRDKRHIGPPLCAIVVGLICLSYNSATLRQVALEATTSSSQLVRPFTPYAITIPTVGIKQYLEPTDILDDSWVISKKHASYLISSARPGENNNIIIYGHNTKQMFADLVKVELGDTVLIESSESIATYRVTRKLDVSPEFVTAIEPTSVETLSIYTCTGLFDSRRLVLQAEPINIEYKNRQICSI